MKQYEIRLSRLGAEETVDGFLSKREAVTFLKSIGLYWNAELNRYEQNYLYTDVYSDYEVDTAWTGAEVVEL